MKQFLNYFLQNYQQMDHVRMLTFSLEKRNYRTKPFVVVRVLTWSDFDADDDVN